MTVGRGTRKLPTPGGTLRFPFYINLLFLMFLAIIIQNYFPTYIKIRKKTVLIVFWFRRKRLTRQNGAGSAFRNIVVQSLICIFFLRLEFYLFFLLQTCKSSLRRKKTICIRCNLMAKTMVLIRDGYSEHIAHA